MISSLMKLKIIIIDDDDFYREQLSVFLKKQGHQIFSVPSGDDGLNIIRDRQQKLQPIDLAFLDYNMPGKTGIAVSHEISAISRHILIVGLTEHDDDVSMEKLHTEGSFIQVVSKFDDDKTLERLLGVALATKQRLRKEGAYRPLENGE